MFRSNVPIVDLSCLQRDKTWSFIPNYSSTDYLTSNEYLIDAIDVSLTIPITYQPRVICGNDQRENHFQRMKQIIFNPSMKSRSKHPCKSPVKPSIQKSKEKPCIPRKQPQRTPSIRCEYITPERKTIIPSPNFTRETKTSFQPTTRDSSVYITSHTRFGRGVLALYFQKQRFISPIENKKKEQFLRLLKV